MTAAVLGKYALIRKIAQGGMGDVFLARQVEGIDRLVILKSLRTESAQEPDFVEQFLDEARVAATLNHPNIVSIYDVGEWEDTFWIVMEYIEGEDLSRLWYAAAKAGVGLPFQVTVRIIHDAAMGLDHAHQATDVEGRHLQIVHRDVSPQNIMVRGDGVTKVVDFGIAKAKNRVSSTQAGLVKGKLQYMSPEQVRGEPLDGKSDQFSLGVCLWEMSTGKRLFKAPSELDTLNKILTHPIPRPSSIVRAFPASLEETVMRMLERDRARRFTTCRDVAHALQGYLDRAPTNKRVRVSDFVKSVIGDQLKERVADLTPMHMAPSRRSSPRVPKPTRPPAPRDATIPDAPPAVAAPRELPIKILVGGGESVSLSDFDEVRKEIFFGHLQASDEIVLGDEVPVPLGQHHALAHLFEEKEPATEAMNLARPGPMSGLGTDGSDDATMEGPAESETGAWTPRLEPEPGPSDEGAALADMLNDPAAEMSLLEEDFVIGDRHTAETLRIEADERGPVSLAQTEKVDSAAVATELVGRSLSEPDYDEYDEADDIDAVFGPKKSRWGTLFAAGLVCLVAAVVVVYFFAPATFNSGMSALGLQPTDNAKVAQPAEVFARLGTDDEGTLRERLAALGDNEHPAALSERAMVTAALSRIQAEQVRVGLATEVAGRPEAETAYRLATQARGAAPKAALSHLAVAHAHLAKGAQIELQSDVEQAASVATAEQANWVKAEGARLIALAAADAAIANGEKAQVMRAHDAVSGLGAGDMRVEYAVAALSAKSKPPNMAPAEKLFAAHPKHKRLAALLGKAPAVETIKTGTGDSPDKATTDKAAADKIAADKAAAEKLAADKAAADKAAAVKAAADKAAAEKAAADKAAAAKVAADAKRPASFNEVLKSAEKARRRGRNRTAIKLYRKALGLQKDYRAYRGLGWAYLDNEETAAAIRAFKSATRADGSDAQSQLGLAESYRFAARIDEARAAYEKVLTKNPGREDRVTAQNALRSLR